MLCRRLVFCRSSRNLSLYTLTVIVCLDRREPFLVELNRRAQRILHTLAQYLSHGCASEEHHMLGYVLWLVTQCLALAAESAAVQEDVHLLHELDPKQILIGIEGRHEPLNTACLHLVGLADLHREHGPSLAQHFPQGGNLVPLGCGVLAAAFRLGCVHLDGVVLVLDVGSDLGCGIDDVICHTFKYSCYGGASVILLALPEGLQVVRLIPFDTAKVEAKFSVFRE